ncbi:MAG: hypothetical protein KGV46_00155 [Pasteurella sp.]|nr:hypothetical protein [Pasteurella sp.]
MSEIIKQNTTTLVETENLVDVIVRKGVENFESSNDTGMKNIEGHILAVVDDITDDNKIMITFNEVSAEALAICSVTNDDIGMQCLVLVQSSLPQPIIMGLIQPANSYPEHLELYAEETITLSCGDSIIEMNKQGHINIQGRSVNSQAYGPNRIKGASVKIN